MKEKELKDLAEKTMNERLYELNLKHILKQAGDDFVKYNLRLKWQMVAWAQGGTN
jgi:hypothetical protein